MPNSQKNSAYLFIHIAVVLWGFTAILGKIIELREFMLVWYRMLITTAFLALLPGIFRAIIATNKRNIAILSGIGALVALHWVCFYGSIKYANASVALSTLATTSAITALVEPFITKRKFEWYELLLGIAVIPGVYLVSRSVPGNFLTGVVLGLMAAVFAALFTSLNKRYTPTMDAGFVTFIELGAGFLFLTALLPLYIGGFGFEFQIPHKADLFWLVILSLACTALPYLLWLVALRSVTAFASNLINNLEPVYGIILAALILGENAELHLHFYIGTALILATVFIQPIVQKIGSYRNN